MPVAAVRAEEKAASTHVGEPAFFSRGSVAGVPWVVLGHVVGTACLLGVSVVTVRVLGPEKYGVFAVCRSLFEYLAILCGLGLNVSLLRFAPELVVRGNRPGLVRLLAKTAILQAGAGAVCLGALALSRPWLERHFQVDLSWLLVLTGVLVCVRLVRLFVDDSLTALMQLRSAALLGIAQSALRLALTILVLTSVPEVHAAIAVHIGAVLIAYSGGVGLLVRQVRRAQLPSPGPGIGARRVARISAPKLANQLIVGISNRYAEIFFLAVFATPAAVGMFELAYAIPLLAVSAIPWSLRKLYVSAFAEAYARDPACTPRLVTAFCRLTAVVVLPISLFGAFFAPRAYEVIYGGEFVVAGALAAVFFVHHALVLLTTPHSAPILAMGKELQMTGVTVVQVAVNLLLDYLLISSFGLYGAAAAVVATFAVNLPIRLAVARRLIGGLFLPLRFYLKLAAPFLLLGVALAPLGAERGLFGLSALGLAHLGGSLALIRIFGLIGPEDVDGFESLDLPLLDRTLAALGAPIGRAG
jgi:O-antigen/teichoic acid export membrane protein